MKDKKKPEKVKITLSDIVFLLGMILILIPIYVFNFYLGLFVSGVCLVNFSMLTPNE